jgi:DNA-binding MarR family transcriptional regulator
MELISRLDEAIGALVRALIIQERQLSNDRAAVPRNPLDLEILSFLDRRPDVQAKEIATYLKISATTLQSAIDRLEKQALLTKDKNFLKGRAVALSLTSQGQAARQLLHAQNIENCEAMLGAIDPLDQEKFIENMVKIASKFSRAV